MQEVPPIKAIRVEVYDVDSNRQVSVNTSDSAIFCINDGVGTKDLNIRYSMVGKAEDLVTLLNYQVQAMTMNFGLKAVVQNGITAPYFVLPVAQQKS